MLKALQDRLRSWKERPAAAATPAAADIAQADFHYQTGLALRRSGHAQDALAAFERALSLRSDHVPALTQQGELQAELRRDDDAADSFALALAFDPSMAAAWLGYGRLMRLSGRFQAAIDHVQRAAELAPESIEAWLELGLSLNQAERTAEAAAAYEKAIEAGPTHAAGYVNLGLLQLTQLGDANRAETLFRKALALEPDSVEAAANLGLALHDQGHSREALDHYDDLLGRHPQNVEYRWHRASVRLGLGDYERGWDDHEARKDRVGRWRKAPPLREWDGTRPAGESLLVYAEQGVGDEIMFASCIPDLLHAGARCVIECDARLAPLFRRSFPQARVQGVDRGRDDFTWLREYPDLSAQCAIGSLPRYFRKSLAAFPQESGYLKPDARRVEHWRNVVGRSDDRLNIGIAWRGGTVETRKQLRSTVLADWDPVFSSRTARFFSLQPSMPGELQAAAQRCGASIEDLAPAAAGFDELAALTAALDLVITIQGTVAHIAGAIGQRVWILLSHSAEWRYRREGGTMPWYRSARLFRQPEPRAWRQVFNDVARALPAFPDTRL